jgi:hypothetical protein
MPEGGQLNRISGFRTAAMVAALVCELARIHNVAGLQGLFGLLDEPARRVAFARGRRWLSAAELTRERSRVARPSKSRIAAAVCDSIPASASA